VIVSLSDIATGATRNQNSTVVKSRGEAFAGLCMNACIPAIANASPLPCVANITIMGIFQKAKLLSEIK